MNTNQRLTLSQYEERAFALYFVEAIRFPYVSYLLMTFVGIWLLRANYSDVSVALWLLYGVAVTVARAGFVHRMRSRLAQENGHSVVLQGFTVLSLALGLFWGAFVWMHLDPIDPLSVMLAGAYVAGHVGGAVTPLSIFLPAFYAFVLPVVLPGVWLLAITGVPMNVALASLTIAYLFTVTGYAHITNRLHRESMRLRYENQRLIDDLEVRKAQAEEASRTKSLFLAGVSHDLKQPIRAIAMYTGFLRHTTTPLIDQKLVIKTAEKIDSALTSVHNLISRMLELSQLESGTVPVRLESLNLEDLLMHVHDSMVQAAMSQGVKLRFASSRHQEVLADRRMVESILVNLVSNAIKHSPGGRVYVGTRLRATYPAGQQLCVEVRDNGSGIPERLQPMLFDAYRSFDDRRSSDSHGLGLAIAQTQAKFLGCEIKVRSGSGCGSTFTLCGLKTQAGGMPQTPLEIRREEP